MLNPQPLSNPHCVPDGSAPGQPNPMFLDKSGKPTTSVVAGEPFTVAVRMATATTTGCPPGSHPSPIPTPTGGGTPPVHPTPVSTTSTFHLHLDADLVLTATDSGDGLHLDDEQLQMVLSSSYQVVYHQMQTLPDIPHDTDVNMTVTDSEGNNPQSGTITITKQP